MAGGLRSGVVPCFLVLVPAGLDFRNSPLRNVDAVHGADRGLQGSATGTEDALGKINL